MVYREGESYLAATAPTPRRIILLHLGCYAELPVDPKVTYTFQVQACETHLIGKDNCTQFSPKAVVSPFGIDACKPGFVWRHAFVNDHVCVVPSTRQRASDDNAQAAAQKVNSGPSPDTCKQPYVWRATNPMDHTCVTSQVRYQTAQDNAQSSARILYGSY
jgi:hypothetical protein